MPAPSVITVRATAKTPPELRHLDGRTYPIRPGVPYPVIGERSSLFGIPGIMTDGMIWEITPDQPMPRSQHSGAQLGDILAVLVEIRDLLRGDRD